MNSYREITTGIHKRFAVNGEVYAQMCGRMADPFAYGGMT